MEITARELRDVEIREAFRGYHRDDVNDLLERAASTLDAANERLRQMSERLSTAQNDTGRSRETEDILHRTLLLAQRAADETVAEAQVKARQMVDDADTQARRTIAEAETEARVRGETERRRLEQEVIDMAARRDALKSDVEMLTRYEGEYRDRLLRSLETDLETLRSRPQVAPGPAPETSDVEVPAANERISRREEAGPPTREIDMSALMKEEQAASSASMPGAGGSNSNGAATSQPKPMATPAPTGPSASANGAGTMAGRGQVATEERTIDIASERKEEPKRAPAPIDLLAAEGAMDAEVLDDEAFFATLREAVHDEAPLGPREDDQSSLFDQDDEHDPAFKDVFRRNR
jgi:cell division initiation protein